MKLSLTIFHKHLKKENLHISPPSMVSYKLEVLIMRNNAWNELKTQNKKQLYVIMCSRLWKLKQEASATPPTKTWGNFTERNCLGERRVRVSLPYKEDITWAKQARVQERNSGGGTSWEWRVGDQQQTHFIVTRTAQGFYMFLNCFRGFTIEVNN